VLLEVPAKGCGIGFLAAPKIIRAVALAAMMVTEDHRT
jgi:hypothetical protein